MAHTYFRVFEERRTTLRFWPLYMTFVGYEKGFDLVETTAWQ